SATRRRARRAAPVSACTSSRCRARRCRRASARSTGKAAARCSASRSSPRWRDPGTLPNLGAMLPRALAFLLASLAALPLERGSSTKLARDSLSSDAVTLALPVVKQDELFDCGLAAVSSLCGYWGIAIPPEERAQLAKTASEREGLSGGELREALERL